MLEYTNFKNLEKDLQLNLVQNTHIQAQGLATPLWNYDIRSINLILLSLKQNPGFVMAEVKDTDGEQIAFIEVADLDSYNKIFSHTVPIKHLLQGAEQTIGSITITLHGDRMLAGAIKNVKLNALILLVLICVIIAATVVAVERTIGVPVHHLLNSIQLLKNNDIRATVPWKSTDELGEVVAAYNEMLINQETAEKAIRQSEEKTRNSEKTLRDAVDSMTDGFALFDENNILVLFNSKYKELMLSDTDVVEEGASYEEIIRAGASLGNFPNDEGMSKEGHILKLLKIGHSYDTPTVIKLIDGRWVLCTQHRTSTGGTVAVRTDITELKHREIALQNAIEEADAANQAKSRFLANMSHELRTPLNAIIGFSDVMYQEMLGALGSVRYKEYAGDIYTSGGHLLDLINDILDVSKIEAGEFKPSNEDLDVSRVIDDSIRLIQQRALARSIALECDIDNSSLKLFADKRAVKQVLLNLLTNAVKFTPNNGVIIIRAYELNTGGIEISVIDTGPGIRDEEIDLVMRPFGRLESPWTQSEEGTGLGLPLSDMIMKAHDGTLKINSSQGKGTTVSVWFPPTRILSV